MPPETEKKLNPLEQTIATQAGQETPAQTLARSRNITKPTGVEAITPTELQPTAVIDVPTPAVATQGQAMAGDIAEQSDAFTRQQEAASTAAEGTKNTALENYLAGLQSSQSVASLTDQEYSKEGGVDSITPELNDINDKIRREQLALRRASEAQAGQGQSKAQTQAAINNLERDSFQKQADLSIIQLATQGRYDSAVAQADRAVNAKFEQQKIYNDTLQFAYSEAKDIFTQAEQREFETLLGNRNRALDTAKENANEIYRIGIEAQREGAPSDVVERMLSAKTKEEAANIGGSYIGALDREAKQASIEASRASTANSYDAIAQRAEQNKAMFGTIDGKAQTDTQRVSELYANRMLEANSVINDIGNQFTGKESLVGERVPNIFKSEDRQKFEQAQRNFINAVLRKESGAVISPEEFSNARLQYFPQPGDSEGVLAQKSQNRNTAITGLYNSANVPMPELQQDVTPTTQLQPGFQGVTTSGISYTVLPDA